MPGPDLKPTATAHIEAVRHRLVGARPAVKAASRQGLFVRQYRHTASQTPGWRLQRERHLRPGTRADVLRLTQMTLASEARPQCLLKLEVYETASPAAAEALMVELLTGFQALPENLVLDSEVGDLDVMLPGDRARLFTRGNLVVTVANAGSETIAVAATAKALDAFITAAPRAAAARKRGAAAEQAPAGAMLRFVAPGGALSQAPDGTLAVEGGSGETHAEALDEQDGSWYSVASGSTAQPPGSPRRGRR